MIRRYIPEEFGAFDPDEIRILSDAFAEARRRVLADGAQFNGQEGLAQEKLAKLIVEIAKKGERDPKRLVENALIRFRL
jgi:hypothetical protein